MTTTIRDIVAAYVDAFDADTFDADAVRAALTDTDDGDDT